jgi:hypothetical protein
MSLFPYSRYSHFAFPATTVWDISFACRATLTIQLVQNIGQAS